MKTLPLIALIPFLAVSCASDSGKKDSTASATSPKAAELTSEERFNKWAGGMSKDNGFVQDSNGNLVPKKDRRSSFESKGEDPNFAGKNFQKKQYKAGDYAKKSFWGNKEYDRQAYAGSTDGSRFQKSSALGEKGARESGSAADLPDDYNTGNYSTGAAREAASGPVAKGSNDQIENRQKVFVQPEIIGWKEQRSMSMDRAKGILGH